MEKIIKDYLDKASKNFIALNNQSELKMYSRDKSDSKKKYEQIPAVI